jgi:hypothetical protein
MGHVKKRRQGKDTAYVKKTRGNGRPVSKSSFCGLSQCNEAQHLLHTASNRLLIERMFRDAVCMHAVVKMMEISRSVSFFSGMGLLAANLRIRFEYLSLTISPSKQFGLIL